MRAEVRDDEDEKEGENKNLSLSLSSSSPPPLSSIFAREKRKKKKKSLERHQNFPLSRRKEEEEEKEEKEKESKRDFFHGRRADGRSCVIFRFSLDAPRPFGDPSDAPLKQTDRPPRQRHRSSLGAKKTRCLRTHLCRAT